VSDVIPTFSGREESKGGGDEGGDLIEVARPDGACERFQFGEREFDRIEVRTVGREKSDLRARLSFAKTGAALLPVTVAASRELIAPMITMIGGLKVPTGRAFGRTSAALTRTAQPTTSGSASFVTMV
jgi:hypothetical protein